MPPLSVLITALNVLLAQPSGPQFEVASIKPSIPREISRPDQRSYGNPGPGKYVARNTPLQLIVAQAYDIRAVHIVGAPPWLSSDLYEIQAVAEVTPDEARSSRTGTQPMFDRDRQRLQALLEERCNLKVHRETRELAIFTVNITKGGLKLQPPNCVTFDPNQPPAKGQPRPAYCGAAPYEQNGASFKVTANGVTMTRLLLQLSNFSERPLVDRTGYAPTFNATVEWNADETNLLTALQEQLGLKLESSKGPIEVLVIDNVTRPSAN